MRDQCNDDVLIVISRADNVIYTSVGATAGKFLTPTVILETDKKILPKLENQQFFEAASEMILTYQDVLQGKPLTQVAAEKHWYSPLPLWAVYAIGGGILLLFVLLTASIVCCVLQRKRRREYTVGRVNYNTRM
uniref:Uncharacterized protein n=2 Tax=Panagrolaimus sp. JU765 TaxID=591449 RepID=A0AC34QWJ3_9BILA